MTKTVPLTDFTPWTVFGCLKVWSRRRRSRFARVEPHQNVSAPPPPPKVTASPAQYLQRQGPLISNQKRPERLIKKIHPKKIVKNNLKFFVTFLKNGIEFFEFWQTFPKTSGTFSRDSWKNHEKEKANLVQVIFKLLFRWNISQKKVPRKNCTLFTEFTIE